MTIGCSDKNPQLVPTADQALTISVDVDLTQVFASQYAREIYVNGAGGTLQTVMKDSGGVAVTYNVQQYQTLSGKFITIKAAGTTATNLIVRG